MPIDTGSLRKLRHGDMFMSILSITTRFRSMRLQRRRYSRKTRLIRRSLRPSTSLASLSTSAILCLASLLKATWRSMPLSILRARRPPIETSLPNSASSSARLARLSRNILILCASIWARSYLFATIIIRRSTVPYSAMVRLSISQRESVVRWSLPAISASTQAEQDSLNARSSLPTTTRMCHISKAVRLRCATRISCMPL